jgi:NAD-dependent deacetylase
VGEPVAIPDRLAAALRSARHVVALTGAGVSAESGVPTFRDAQTGLWAKFRPEDLATPEAFRRDPAMVWDWYAFRREAVARVEPNPGHVALARLAARVPRLTLVTQNVDGLHRRAGSPAVIELHGNILATRCLECDKPQDPSGVAGSPPPCECGRSVQRPDVVWFGENLPRSALDAAMEATDDCDVFLSIGTSTVVYPAAELPFRAARRGALVVEINPDPTPLSQTADIVLRHSSGAALPAILVVMGER